ncbi:hypothetical protein [Streptomyces sp. NPDC007063]|uniref:hypothetical protein n=1 Tax=Streptomyces sp. NPDC007063 TaxID=3364772 RepID=UPI0036976547
MSKRHHTRHAKTPPPAWDDRDPNQPMGPQQPPSHGGEWPPDQPPDEPKAPKRKHRVFLWVFLAVQMAFLIWAIAGGMSGSGTPEECRGLTGAELQDCKDAADVGTTIGVGLIIALWAAVDFILLATYIVYRLSKRQRRD